MPAKTSCLFMFMVISAAVQVYCTAQSHILEPDLIQETPRSALKRIKPIKTQPHDFWMASGMEKNCGEKKVLQGRKVTKKGREKNIAMVEEKNYK